MRGQRPMSTFGADKFTTRSREAIEAAQLSATTGGHTQTEPIHLLVALLREQEGTARNLVTKAGVDADALTGKAERSEEHTSELQSLMRISYDVFCLTKKKNTSLATTTQYNQH